MKEMSGNGIFSDNAEDSASEPGSVNSNNRTSIRIYQVYFNNILDHGSNCYFENIKLNFILITMFLFSFVISASGKWS